ncbi:MAG: hypothetical protein HQK49_14255 [Oligoflexia bacterium]|nr:hypothetical protein [Oligoflexia bacterium]
MKNFDEIKSVLSETQKYIKLTRALIISRILNGLSDLDKEQKLKMDEQLKEIKRDLGMNDGEFSKALKELEHKHNQEYLRRSSDTNSGQKDSTINASSKGNTTNGGNSNNGANNKEKVTTMNTTNNNSNKEVTKESSTKEISKERELEGEITGSFKVVTKRAYCLNKKCRNKFMVTVITAQPVNKRCSICGSDSAILLEVATPERTSQNQDNEENGKES